jgi:CheY-like chemotaxis protein
MVGAGELQQDQEAEISRTILVVEDEVLVRMMITDQLRNAGYTVFEAADADETLDLLTHIIAVTVIITDATCSTLKRKMRQSLVARRDPFWPSQ